MYPTAQDSTGFSFQMDCLTLQYLLCSVRTWKIYDSNTVMAERYAYFTHRQTVRLNSTQGVDKLPPQHTPCERSRDWNKHNFLQKNMQQRHCVFRFGVEPMPIDLTFIGLKGSCISKRMYFDKRSIQSIFEGLSINIISRNIKVTDFSSRFRSEMLLSSVRNPVWVFLRCGFINERIKRNH